MTPIVSLGKALVRSGRSIAPSIFMLKSKLSTRGIGDMEDMAVRVTMDNMFEERFSEERTAREDKQLTRRVAELSVSLVSVSMSSVMKGHPVREDNTASV